jgi:DNA-binding NtrC family response regulator
MIRTSRGEAVARILLIDDDDTLRATVRDMATALGHSVETSGDGASGLKILRRDRFDLVITDVLMPGTDGFGVVKTIDRETLDLPVIAMSGGSARIPAVTTLTAARAIGVSTILIKPFGVRDLADAIETALAG